MPGTADRRGHADQLRVGLTAVERYSVLADALELRPQRDRLGDRLQRLARHRRGEHRVHGVVVVGGQRLAQRGAVGGVAAAAPSGQPDRPHHDAFQVHDLGPVEDGELRRQPGLGRQRLQVRERRVVEPVAVNREGTELEHPHADAVPAVIAFQPANLAQLVDQAVQGRLRQPGALVEVAEAQHVLAAVERLHDGGAAAQHGVLRVRPFAVRPHRGHPGSGTLGWGRCRRNGRTSGRMC